MSVGDPKRTLCDARLPISRGPFDPLISLARTQRKVMKAHKLHLCCRVLAVASAGTDERDKGGVTLAAAHSGKRSNPEMGCTNCGGKGVTLQRPGWAGNHIGFYPFPTSSRGAVSLPNETTSHYKEP
jgi:hypothetical protein